MTKRESIIRAIVLAVSGITGLPVYRSRAEPFARGKSPALVVEPIQDIPANNVIPYLDWELQVRLSLIIRHDEPDKEGDPFVEQIHAAVLEDQSLGGLSMDIQPVSVNYEIIEADATLGIIALDFRVTYRTQFDSLV